MRMADLHQHHALVYHGMCHLIHETQQNLESHMDLQVSSDEYLLRNIYENVNTRNICYISMLAQPKGAVVNIPLHTDRACGSGTILCSDTGLKWPSESKARFFKVGRMLTVREMKLSSAWLQFTNLRCVTFG